MTGKELLPLIRSKGKDDKYSENLMKWVRKHKDWPMIAAFTGHCMLTGEKLIYDLSETRPQQIIIGFGDMSDGWIHGRRLSSIICGEYGVMSTSYAFSRQFHLSELPDWWQRYIESGKCFIDPTHSMYGDRWQLSKDGKTRTCKWCGNYHQKKHTEMIPKTTWRQQ